VPTDQSGPLLTAEAPPATSPIENELPTYRAISTRAVFSVICGILASFSFASLSFLAFAVLAIVLGVMANLAIKRAPDVLTGRRLANVGIAMGLIFGLTVLTYSGVQTFVVRRAASTFAQEYAGVLKRANWGEYLLYRDMPEQRTKTAAEKETEYNNIKSREKFMMEQRMSSLVGLKKALTPPDSQIHFVDVETTGIDESLVGGIYYFATALYEVESPVNKGAREFALAVFKSKPKGRHFDWWVEETVYPYKPKSFQVKEKPIDDGHGHAPGAH
jgi:hypothetical protein